MSDKSPTKPADSGAGPSAGPSLGATGQARAAEREARRAAALRANLNRRKAQTRARDSDDAAPGEPIGHTPVPKA